MSISIKLVDSKAQFARAVNKALSEELNNNLKKNKDRALKQVKSLIPAWIEEQPEIQSILDQGVFGSLNAQFGFIVGTAPEAVSAIVSAVSESVFVEFGQVKSDLSGGITFYFQPDTFSNLLSLPQASIPALTGPLPWLEWLLTRGSTTIVSGYSYNPDDSGRSGGGTMRLGSAWRVPPQFAGTIEDNFISRALLNREKELSSILRGAING
jgi:hypothetical protein